MNTRLIAIGVVATAALACSSEDAQTSSPEVTVVKAAEGAASPLTTTVSLDHSEQLDVDLLFLAEGKSNDGQPSAKQVLGLTFSLKATITEVTAERVRADLSIEKLRIDDVREKASDLEKRGQLALTKAVNQMPQLGGEIVTTPTGFVTKLEVGSKKGLSNQQRQIIEALRSSIYQLQVPRPASIAAPSTWSSEQELSRQGFALKQKLTSTLAPTGEIDFEVAELAGGDTVSPPGVYADSIALENFRSTGTGTAKIPRDRLFPATATLTINSSADLVIEQAGSVDRVSTKSAIRIAAKGR